MSRSKKNWDHLVDYHGNYDISGGGPGGGGTGAKGQKGSQGPEGPQGEKGAEGPDGPKGDKGTASQLLTYKGEVFDTSSLPTPDATNVGWVYYSQTDNEYYVSDGSTWDPIDLALVEGPKGDTGDEGAKGEVGDTGPEGPKGEKGDDGEKGNKGDEGPPGLKGDDGEKGEQAVLLEFQGSVQSLADLVAIADKENGHVWYVEDENALYAWSESNGTWVQLTGLQAPIKGEDGEKGEQGEKGDGGKDLLDELIDSGLLPPGSDADDLADFVKGEDGEKGDKGDDLIETLKGEGILNDGDGGDELAELLKGEKGDRGDQGPTGAEGIQGQPGTGIDIIGSIGTDNPNTDPGAPTCDTAGNAVIDVNGDIWICDGSGNWIESGPIQGPQGPTGPEGVQGPTGEKGGHGPEGLKGQKGAKGEDGVAGGKGDQGEKGSQGDEGLQGAPGMGINILGQLPDENPPTAVCDTAGDAYVTPGGLLFVCDGAGNWGEISADIVGPQGPKGDQGDQGPQGDKGDNLLDTLIDEGVLSPGAKGDELAEALKGEKGDKGDDLLETLKGEGILSGTDGGDELAALLKGEKGELGHKGMTGEEGPQGQPGPGIDIIGSISGNPNDDLVTNVCDTAGNALLGDNGEVWVCDGNGTWIESGAIEGPKGQKGPEGERGLDGPKGDKGERGIRGVRGPKGQKGNIGETGVEGPEGIQGPEGPQGVPGGGIQIIGSLPDEKAPGVPCSNGGDAFLTPSGKLWICDGAGTWIYDDNTRGPEGPQGPQGQRGEKGDEGEKGEPLTYDALLPEQIEDLRGDKGKKGEKGDNLLETLKGEGVLPPSADGNDLVILLKGDQGPKGDKGQKGGNAPTFTFKGEVPSFGDLSSTGNTIGDVYKTQDDSKFYAWTGTNWVELPGVTAIKGEKGDEGVKGNTGDQGPKGDTGDKGDNLLDTLKGEGALKGDADADDLVDLLEGEKGDEGEKGERGQKGEKGENLMDTLKGEGTLPPDAKGDDLAELLKGEKGQKGATGSFADFTPSEIESLKGEKGAEGAKGDKGTDAPTFLFKGELPAYSDLPDSGNTEGDIWHTQDDDKFYGWDGSNWVEMPGISTVKGQKGEVGEQGIQGVKGDQGPDLIETLKGDGTLDPGDGGAELAELLKGEQGDTGPQGEVGPQGPKGDQGPDLLETLKGDGTLDGTATGDDLLELLKGDTGDQGFKGQKGEEGEKGLDVKGEPGEKGDGGEKGDDGQTGPKGSEGEKGEASSPFTFKGSVDNIGELPTDGSQTDGDIYYNEENNLLYAWSGTEWVQIGNSASGGTPTLDQVTTEGGQTENNIQIGAILKLDDGENVYNGGPHELEARKLTSTLGGLFFNGVRLASTFDLMPIYNGLENNSNQIIALDEKFMPLDLTTLPTES